TRYVERSHPAGVVLAALAFAFFVVAQTVAPPSATLIEIYSTPTSIPGQHLRPDSCDERTIQPIFAHISDLHITEEPSTRDGKSPGNIKLAPLLQRLNEYKPPFLIISGDITDQGTAPQWRLMEQLLGPLHSDTKI